MFDQSYTAENFRRIFDLENRKGVNLEGCFFPELIHLTKRLREISLAFKKNKAVFKQLNKEMHQISALIYNEKIEILRTEKEKLNLEKNELISEKESLLMQKLGTLAKTISEKNFAIKIAQNVDLVGGKHTYSIGQEDANSYFAIKQLQYSLKKLYKVKQSNRHLIVGQLRAALADKLEKWLFRTDIESFYETISTDSLLEKISSDSLLTYTSKKFIKQIINQYHQLSGSTVGVPRGIGISAYLSELYLRRFDEWLLGEAGVLYYARYVDDIVVLKVPEENKTIHQFSSEIRTKLADSFVLKINETKTETIEIKKSSTKRFCYLGYSFEIHNGLVEIDLSPDKRQRYFDRITLILDAYAKHKNNEKKERKLLLKRARFLTGNTKLSHSKSKAYIGTYFSNMFLSTTATFQCIDIFWNKTIDEKGFPVRLQTQLKKYTFSDGFETKRFSKFSINELNDIVRVWKNV